MRTLEKTLVITMLASASVSAMAANTTATDHVSGSNLPYYKATNMNLSASNDHGTYVGIKTGASKVEKDKSPEFNNAKQVGLFGGVSFDNRFGLEAEYTQTNEVEVTSKLFGNGEYSLANYGAFVTYKHPVAKNLYVKSKVGIGGVDANETYKNKDNSVNNIGVTGGMRLGYELSKTFAVEGEYNMFNSKEVGSESLTVGALYKF